MSKNDATCQIHISKYLHLLQLYALIPVSVAGAERSFSILKLIKTKLRNRTGDERLSNLAIISINKNTAQK